MDLQGPWWTFPYIYPDLKGTFEEIFAWLLQKGASATLDNSSFIGFIAQVGEVQRAAIK